MVGMGREIFDRAREACDTRTMADVLADDCEELLQEGIPFAESPLASWNVLLYEAYVALGGGGARAGGSLRGGVHPHRHGGRPKRQPGRAEAARHRFVPAGSL